MVVVNADDAGAVESVEGIARQVLTFGLHSTADVHCANLTYENNLPVFDIMYHGRLYAHVALRVPGQHNVYDALAAAAAAIALKFQELPLKRV